MPTPQEHPISLTTAAVLSGRSLRTWQRRVEDGVVPRLGGAGGRTLVPFAAVRPALAVALDDEDVAVLERADQGDAAAQADIGARLALAALREARDALLSNPGGGSIAPALHFLTQAAQQGEADAMHWLATVHAAGLAEGHGAGDTAEPGADTAEALALMWLAKAAAHGHAIARQQLAQLMPGAVVGKG